MLIISLLGKVGFVIITCRKSKSWKENLFSNAVKVMLFFSDVQYYTTADSVYSFKIKENLFKKYLKIKKYIIGYNEISLVRGYNNLE